MSERWDEGPTDGAPSRERPDVPGGTNGVLEPSKPAETAGPGEGAMYEPDADEQERDRTPDEVPDDEPRLADSRESEPGEEARLEERLRRLEDALAQLQDFKGMETRVAERVASQIRTEPAPDRAPSGSSAGVLWEAGKRLLASHAAPPPERTEPGPSAQPGLLGFFRDLFVELRAMVYMFVDPRYHMSWWGRGSAMVLLALFLASFWLVPGTSIPLVGYWINKLADLVLAYFLVKTLAREARRYRALSPDLPAQLR